MVKKTLYYLFLSVSFAIFLIGCENTQTAKNQPVKKAEALKIMTTNYLLYTMVQDIIGEKNQVDFMFKNEIDQFSFKYTEDSIDNISKKDIFIYTGGSYEPWIDAFLSDLNKNKVTILNVSRGTKIMSRDVPLKYSDKTKVVDIKDNPYYWLDNDKYKTALFNICKTIEDKDPFNKSYYENNFKENIKTVDEYDKKLKEAAKNLKDYTFVVQGDDLDYFTKYLGLKTIKIPSDINYIDTSSQDYKNLQDKFTKIDKIIYLYSKDNEEESNAAIIKEYSMQVAKVNVYNYKFSFIELLKANTENLTRLAPEKLNN